MATRNHLKTLAFFTFAIIMLSWVAVPGGSRSFDESDGGIAGAECPADIAPPTGNGIVNVDDLLAVIGGWGPCASPCSPSCIADVVQDCVVNVDDLLAVIGAWGSCPACPADPGEPGNNLCDGYSVPSIGSNQTLGWSSSNLGVAGDQDYFRIHMNETDGSCSCCDFWCFDEDFKLTVTLAVPASADGAYELCISTSCSSFTNCVSIAPGLSASRELVLDGSCPDVNEFNAQVRVRALSANAVDCAPYTLTYTFTPGCF
jgi:hypothetical protein